MKILNCHTVVLACALGVWGVSPKAAAAYQASCFLDVQTICCAAQPKASETPAKNKPDLLTTCPVSGEKLGEMGDPHVFIYKDQEVKLCCKNCKKDFDKDPEKYLKLIRAADKK